MNLSPVQTLRAHGVCLYIDPQSRRMRYRAPAGVLTLELAGMIAEVAMQYEERAAIREYDARIDRAEAERLAAADLLGPVSDSPSPLLGPFRAFHGITTHSDTSKNCVGFPL